MTKLSLFSPAKVNLFLKVVNRRSDAFHELASLFQTISLGDTLHCKLSQEDSLTCDVSDIPTDGRNLIRKASALFREKTGVSCGLEVHLEKRIPHEAGLGGGSSNAASTLWAFNTLSGGIATVKQLQDWGALLGSDVPFFLSRGTAFCSGRGEQVQNLAALAPQQGLIVKPRVSLPTPSVYNALNLDNLGVAHLDRALEDWRMGQTHYFNDLESPAFFLEPILAKLKLKLIESGFHTVLLCGSGSAFFCLGEGLLPKDEGLLSFPVYFINREGDNWYPSQGLLYPEIPLVSA